MRACEKCDSDFTPRGRQKVCNICKGANDAVQKQETEEARPKRPLERFGNGRFVFGGSGVMLRR